jgi:anti-sigma factor RsiW
MERMSECPEVDRLVSAAELFGDDWEEEIRHLARCAECRAALGDLASMRAAFHAAVEPRPGFVDEVVRAALARGPATSAERAPRAAAPLLAAATFAAAAVLAAGSGAAGAAHPLALALAAAVGAVAGLRGMRSPSGSGTLVGPPLAR